MRQGGRWLVFAVTVVGVVTVGLVVLVLLVPGLGWGGMRPYGYGMGGRGTGGYCPWCGGTGFQSPWGTLASMFALLFLLVIPIGFLALLVAGIVWLARSAGRPRSAESLNCPHCAGEVEPGWKACPSCGERMEE